MRKALGSFWGEKRESLSYRENSSIKPKKNYQIILSKKPLEIREKLEKSRGNNVKIPLDLISLYFLLKSLSKIPKSITKIQNLTPINQFHTKSESNPNQDPPLNTFFPFCSISILYNQLVFLSEFLPKF